jgi:hypothetical protein
MKGYWETDRKFCRLTYTPAGEPEPVSVWAEVGNVVDNIVQWFFEVNEHTTNREAEIYVQLGEFSTEPARYNLDTKKMEPVKE